MSGELPSGVADILRYLAQMARGYNNHLTWNEVAKLKADLMNTRRRWIGVPVEAIAAECRTLGMRDEDVREIAGLVRRARAGRRLVPQAGYRDFRFNQPIDQAGG